MDSTGRAWLRAGEVVPGEDGLTRSEVSSELSFDPSGHVRLPIDDDEIIDRALAIEPLADGKVTLLTYDTGQFTRARNAGLQVVKLSQEVGDEPGKRGAPDRRRLPAATSSGDRRHCARFFQRGLGAAFTARCPPP